MCSALLSDYESAFSGGGEGGGGGSNSNGSDHDGSKCAKSLDLETQFWEMVCIPALVVGICGAQSLRLTCRDYCTGPLRVPVRRRVRDHLRGQPVHHCW